MRQPPRLSRSPAQLGRHALGAVPNGRVMGEVNPHRFEGTQALDRGDVLLRLTSGGYARDRGVRLALPLRLRLERLARTILPSSASMIIDWWPGEWPGVGTSRR